MDNKVVITGGGGFIGKNLTKYLYDLGFKVFSFSKSEMDVRDKKSIHDRMSQLMPNYIIHLAAKSRVTDSISDPHLTMETNVLGTVNILEEVREVFPSCKVIIAGSAAEYGKGNTPFSEDSPLHPVSPYGVSKVTQEQLGIMYAKTFDLNICVLRLFNQSGKGKQNDMISDIVRQVKSDSIVVNHGNLNTYRDYTHIDDTCEAFLKAMTLGRSGEVYNICSGYPIKTREIIEEIMFRYGKGKTLNYVPSKGRWYEEQIIYGINDKARCELGWQPSRNYIDIIKDMFNG
jgi:GDP-4-dehydro-6-deoxy-D-mannose reductase